MTAADNPYFAKAAVNRMWAYFFGTALVGQSETGGDEGPKAHAELLDELAKAFAANKFDVKFLVRASKLKRQPAPTHEPLPAPVSSLSARQAD